VCVCVFERERERERGWGFVTKREFLETKSQPQK
jgi:hypothetical protein